MKKILLATSAVALFAGAAAAEVTVSGSARMGIVSVDDGASTVNRFSSRVRIVFTASGETDSGLSFGASMRADQEAGNDAANGSGGDTNGDSTVYISGAFGKFTMGDVSGAADALVGQVSGVGYGPNDDTQEINFLGALKTAAYYEYSTGAVTFGLGAGQIDTDESNALFDAFAAPADTYSIGVKYATDAYSAAIAWESADAGATTVDMISLGGSATFGAATVKARVSDLDVSGVDTAYALSVDYAMGATTLTAFFTDYGNSGLALNPYHQVGATDTQHIGIGASYDLGGGATVAGGYTVQNNDGIEDGSIANLGLKFSF